MQNLSDLSNIFQYFRPLNNNSRSLYTMDLDMGNVLNITTNFASELYNNYKLHYIKEKPLAYDKNYLKDVIEEFEIEDSNYKDYLIKSDKNNEGLYKFVYSIQYDKFLYLWIDTYKQYMPQTILRKLQTIINTTYDNRNTQINEYMRKKYLQTALMEFGSNKFMKFYDYCRLQYLLQQTKQFNFIPKFYDQSTGLLYFTTKNRLKTETVLNKYIYNKLLNINFYPLLIVNEDNILDYHKDLNNNKWKSGIKIDFETPNFVRHTLDYILSRNTRVNSLDEAKLQGYKNCVMLEDCCKKSYDGLTMQIPNDNRWQTLNGAEVRKYSKNKAQMDLLFQTYDSLLNNTLQSVWS